MDNKIDKTNVEDILTLTSIQEGMLFHYAKEQESSQYIEQLRITLTGAIQVELIKETWRILSKNNEMLRTVFRWRGLEKPVEIVLKNHVIPIEVMDISNYDSTKQVELLREIKVKDRERGIDLSSQPLRITLVKIQEDDLEMIITNHHILYDGWSTGILLKEFFNVYEALIGGTNFQELQSFQQEKTKYKDFVKWYSKRDIAQQKQYWEKYLEDFSSPTSFPKINFKNNSQIDSNKMNQEETTEEETTPKQINHHKNIKKVLNLPTSLVEEIEDFCKKNQITLATLFYAGWGLLLGKYSNSIDVTFGTTISGRPPEIQGIEKMVGLFINTLPLRVKMEKSQSMRGLLQKVDSLLKERTAYENTPLVEIQQYSGIGKQQLFDNIVVIENYPIDQLIKEIEGHIRVKDYSMVEQTHYDLTLGISVLDGIDLSLAAGKGYDPWRVEGLLNHYQNILTAMVSNPDENIEEIEILSSEEKQQILVDFNSTKADHPKNQTLQELFEEQVEKNPQNIAVVYENQNLTYGELNEKANQLARLLTHKGVGRDTIVGIMVERSVEMIIGVMGILKAGGGYLPIDPEYPEDRIKYMLEDSGAEILLTQSWLQSKENLADIFHGEFLLLDLEDSYRGDGENLGRIANPQDLAYIIYTSGSTGRPKGVMIEHRSVVNLVAALQDRVFGSYTENMKVALLSPYVFDASVQTIFSTLLLGYQLHIVPQEIRRGGLELLNYYNDNEIDISDGTPIHINMLSVLENRRLTVKHFIIGGEALSQKVVEELFKNYPDGEIKITNVYGPTECCVDTTSYLVTREKIKYSIPIGKPINNAKIYILDENMKIQPIGVAGEIYIGGDGLARGYLNKPELTKEKFVNNPFEEGERMYRTGDLGRWLSDGNIEFLGRIDHQVKIRGYRIELGEIENQLLKLVGVKEAVVISKEIQEGSKYLVAYVVGDKAIEINKIRQALSKVLPEYMIPEYILQLEKMPLTPNGKIDRKALPEVDGSILEVVEYEAPRKKVEEALVSIWEEILDLQGIGINHNFFEVGGHSLRATALVAKIHKVLKVEIPLKEIFQKPTIKGLAELIEASQERVYSGIEPVEEKEYYTTSPAQRRIYTLQQFDPQGLGYNMPAALLLEGSVDLERLEETFKKLIHRHEALRTSFMMEDGEPVQYIHKEVAFKLQYQEAKEVELEEILAKFLQPFDLRKAPLLRVGLVKILDDEMATETTIGTYNRIKHLLIFDMHHIISDGVSMGVLVKEFAEIYRGESLNPLRLQYRDYSEWQKESIVSGKLEKQKQYWLQQFEGEIPVLNLMGDYPRPALQSFEGDRLDFQLGEALTQSLKKIAKETGATMYMVLLSALNIVLSKYSGQEDIIVGSTIAGRSHGDLSNIIGMFVNTLAMRNYPEGSKTFKEFLIDVKNNALGAYQHQDYQFEDLVENLNIRRDMSRNPLFDVMFTMQNMELEELKLEEVSIKPYGLTNKIAKFDLTLFVKENENTIDFGIEYATKLFKKKTIERFYKHLENILGQIAINQGVLLSEIQLITEEEKQQLLLEFNDTKASYPVDSTIHQIFENRVANHPEAVAVIFEDNHLTYGELNKRANQLARVFRNMGVKPDTIVALMMERSLELIVGVMAILKAGGAYLPIDPKFPQDRKSYMLEESQAQILLTQSHLQREIDFIGEVLFLDDEAIYIGEDSNLNNVNKPHDLAYVLFTSGSTGRPKGVMIQHQSSINTMTNLQKQFPILKGDAYLLKTNYCFDVSVIELFSWFTEEAGKLVILKPSEEMEPKKIMAVIKREKITHINFVPSMMQVFVDTINGENIEDLRSLKYVILGGEAVTKDLASRFYDKTNQLEISLENIYGPTENSIYCSRYAIPKVEDHCSVPIGTPVPNVQIYILNGNLQQQPIGVPGELCIAGDGLGRGYLNRPELTTEKFISHPFTAGERMYRTGDLARWLEDGNLEYLGRIDHQVKIRGYRIELGEIENSFLRHENIQEAVVMAKEGEDGTKYLCGYFTADQTLTTGEVKEHLSRQLPEYMVPTHILQLEQFPLTSSGKVDRRGLPEIAKEDFKDDEYEAPRNEIEEKLVEIWQEILGVKRVGTRHNFFELGGHSLKATRMIAMIHNRLNIEIPLSELFKNPTIKSLGEYINGTEEKGHENIAVVPATEYYPLSAAQRRIYLQAQTEDNSTAYNMSFGVILEGDLNRKQVEDAINGLVKRHEGLRTSFIMVQGIPMQRIEKELRINTDYYEAEVEGLEAIVKDFIKPFELEKSPLLRVSLVKLQDLENIENETRHLLLFDHHHIISDGLSARILTRDFIDLYEGKNLKPLRIQYKDYAAWHNALLGSEELNKLEDFWLRKLNQFVETNLPIKGTSASEVKGKTIKVELNEAQTEAINQFCIQHQVTKAVLILAVFKLLIGEAINQDQVTVGIPVAGRRHMELENVMGVFLNVLILPSYIPYDGKFLDFLQGVRDDFMEIQEYQDYPYELLHKEASKKLMTEDKSLFSILYNYMPYEEEDDLGITGLTIKPYELQEPEAKYSLTLYVREKKDKITLEALYHPHLEDYTVENILSSIPTFLEEIVNNKELVIEDLVSPQESPMGITEEYDMMFDDNDDFF